MLRPTPTLFLGAVIFGLIIAQADVAAARSLLDAAAIPTPTGEGTPVLDEAPSATPTSDNGGYDFGTDDPDFTPLANALPYANMTRLPQLPDAVRAAIPAEQSTFVSWNPAILSYNRELWARRANKKIVEAVTTLREMAETLMSQEPVYDPRNKTNLATSGDPRDYISLSDFYWPQLKSRVNPAGIPYTYQPSRNLETYDLAPNYQHMDRTFEHVKILALAYHFTGEQKYARRATDKVRMWFTSPESSMRPNLQFSSIVRGVTTKGRPQGIFDMVNVRDLLNGVALLDGSQAWTAQDRTALQAWFSEFAAWMESDTLAVTARKMGNYIATAFDEILMSIYIFIERYEDAARIGFYSPARREDQIIDGVVRYEISTGRSLDFTQECIQSYVNIAIMGERLGLDLWTSGLDEGHAVKDAFDVMRPYWESLGVTWPYRQVGTPRVRVAAQVLPRLYVGHRIPGSINTGPREYISLYNRMWPTFTTEGSRERAIVDRLVSIELDSDFAMDGVPDSTECNSISCDTTGIIIWSITGSMLFCVGLCIAYNYFIHYRANTATDIPGYLRAIRDQQLRMREAGVKIEPAKPGYLLVQDEERKLQEDADRLEEARRAEEKRIRDERRAIEAKLEEIENRKRQQSQPTAYTPSFIMPSDMAMMSPGMSPAPMGFPPGYAVAHSGYGSAVPSYMSGGGSSMEGEPLIQPGRHAPYGFYTGNGNYSGFASPVMPGGAPAGGGSQFSDAAARRSAPSPLRAAAPGRPPLPAPAAAAPSSRMRAPAKASHALLDAGSPKEDDELGPAGHDFSFAPADPAGNSAVSIGRSSQLSGGITAQLAKAQAALADFDDCPTAPMSPLSPLRGDSAAPRSSNTQSSK